MSSVIGYNWHHGVPRSFTGSGEGDSNLTYIDAEEHADFHTMAGHLPPDFFVRKVLLASIDWQNSAQHSLPLGFYRDVIQELLREDWRSCYVQGVTRGPQESGNDKEAFARKAIHVHSHIASEQYQVADAIQHLSLDSYLSPQSRSYRDGASAFFGENNPATVIRKYLLDATAGGEYKWSKPLRQGVRSRLLDATRIAGTPEVRTRKDRYYLQELMHAYRTDMAQCFELWQPNVNNYFQVIQEKRDKPFFREFLMRSA